MRALHAAVVVAIMSYASLAGAQSSPSPASARQAHDAARDSVRATIAALFDGMRAGDTAAMRATFMPGVLLLSVNSRQVPTRVDTTSIDDFLASVAQASSRNPALVLDERLGRVVIEVDDALATAWTEYEFWAGERFSHCGANTFSFVRTGEGWRIFQLADSRRREGCSGGN
jgi:ketosteroid isomerase-like protein